MPGMSQEINITASNYDVNSSSTLLHRITGHDRDYYYVCKYYGNLFYLEKLDHNLNLLIKEPIRIAAGLQTYTLETVVHFYDELYVFLSRTRLTDVTLYYQKINKNNLLPSTGLIELTTVKCIKGAWADFHFALSRHETKLLVACRTKLAWSGAQFNEYYVFGENLNLVWGKKDTYEFNGQGPRDNKYIVDETGNVSILSLVKRESILSLIRVVKNLYTIYRYTRDGESYDEYAVTLTDRYIRDVRIVGGENGELICAGLYSEIFNEGVRGTFFFKIDPLTNRRYDEYLNEFDNAVLAQLAEMKETMLKNVEPIKYNITDMVLRQSGKVIIIAEQVLNQPYDTYNNLIVTCYDVDGKVYWTRIIEKNQNFSQKFVVGADIELSEYRNFVRETGFLSEYFENYCSYALMAPLDKDGIIIFFNDDVRNMDQEAKKRNFKHPKKSYILAISIDEFGSISRRPLTAWRKKASFPEPIRFYDTRFNTIVIPAFRYRKFNYYKITANF